jgi:hypothetical protein
MSLGEEFVGKFLAHYASEYYDPDKAHEYYLRNRELKGKQSTSELTRKGDKAGNERRKEAWSYTKNQIGEAQKAELKGLSEANKQFLEKARTTAQARREEISSKLKTLLETLTQQKKDDAESVDAAEEAEMQRVDEERATKSRKIREDAQKQIDAIPAIPDGVRGPARERLVAAREKKIARINGNAARDIGTVRADAAAEREAISAEADAVRSDLSTQNQEQKQGSRESSRVDREKVSTDLKATVEKARADYEAGKERVKADFEAKKQKEFDAIKTRVR